METERLSAGSIIVYGKLWQGPGGDAPAKRLASTAVAGGSAMLGSESGQRRRRPFWACEEVAPGAFRRAFRSEHWSEHRTLNTCFPITEQCSEPTLVLLIDFARPDQDQGLCAPIRPSTLIRDVLVGAETLYF